MDILDSSCVSTNSAVRINIYEKLSSMGVALPDEGTLHLRSSLEDSSITSPVTTPKPKKRRMTVNERECCFGVALPETNHLAMVRLDEKTTARVPGALVTMVEFLEEHIQMEGIFRKTGSLPRQKQLRVQLCRECYLQEDASAHDIANLLKVYFRELPICLFLNQLLSSFIFVAHNFQHSPTLMDRLLLDLCLLLPESHQFVLQYTLQFFYRVSRESESNLMDLDNLAVVLTPNLMPSMDAACPDLELRTTVVKILIRQSRWLSRRRREVLRGNLDRVQSLSSLKSGTSEDSMSHKARKIRRRPSFKDLGHMAIRKGKALAAENPLRRKETFKEKKPSLLPEILKPKKTLIRRRSLRLATALGVSSRLNVPDLNSSQPDPAR
ncbi:rho GTPase-activating protein 11A-like [Sycon ciliatum]|uniref:rho GTPase-activating protein 11A-like n=1 Tax=Sycon ciliatum TaxID=27933 RepID=UPI0020AEA057|eukprot:scpid57685/ scgid34980/ Rho GTPase-activating protein 11A; Rho-type GTPase-activating protein 11A